MRILNWLLGRRPTTPKPEEIQIRVQTSWSSGKPDGPVLRLMTAGDGDWPVPVDLGGEVCLLDYTDVKGRARRWEVALIRARQSTSTVLFDVHRTDDNTEVTLRADRIRAIRLGRRSVGPRDFLRDDHGVATAYVSDPRECPPDPNGPLAGERVSLTGTFNEFSQAGARKTIRDAGGTLVGRVDDETTLLVVGTEPNLSATKVTSARKRGVPILDEAAFLERLRSRS